MLRRWAKWSGRFTTKRSRACAGLLGLLALVASCGLRVPRARMPDDLQNEVDVYPVKGGIPWFHRKVRFGPYVAKRAHVGFSRGYNSDPTIFNGRTEKSYSKRTGVFDLWNQRDRVVKGKCSRTHEYSAKHQVTSVGVDSKRGGYVESEKIEEREQVSVLCELHFANGLVRSLNFEGGAGHVTGNAPELTVVPITEQTDQPFPSSGVIAGYVVQNEVRSLGAVDLGAASTITFARDLSEHARAEVAGLLMAVLLKEHLQ